MNTVSREMAQRLKEAGWEKETYFVWVPVNTAPCGIKIEWLLYEKTEGSICYPDKWLPAPDLYELLEEVEYHDFLSSFRHSYPEHRTFSDNFFSSQFSVYLNRVMRDPDAVAEVWGKLHEGATKEQHKALEESIRDIGEGE